jgi:hypothetical protein
MTNYVTDSERTEYRAFVERQMRTLAKNPPPILWHYTKGDALIKIVESGTLLSTQIACVNDAHGIPL